MRVMPSSPMTGRTQVMHTPMPQAMDSSTAIWATAPNSPARRVTLSSIGIGPQA